jgi:protein-L-isoaspartate(D-aspartate) O-methyltransferase
MTDTDNILLQKQRQFMVEEQLRNRGIRDEKLLALMADIPRHLFIPPENRHEAYLDQPVSIGYGQTISQPYIVALMTQSLLLEPNHEVLEIGAGCGYQTAILAALVRRVYAVERLDPLLQLARQNLERLNIRNVDFCLGDGAQGWPDAHTFDRILVAAAADRVPPRLLDQLACPGRMVIPVGEFYDQKLLLIEKKNHETTETLLCYCRFVRLIENPQ